MARTKSKKKAPKRRSDTDGEKKQSAPRKSTAGRPIWTGSIDFGLVNIPVKLFSAESSSRIDLDLLDKRDFSRVRYKRVSEKSGREVPWDDIVKGYEYKKGDYVAVTDADFARANVEASRSITIADFVDREAISPLYFDKPYYLEPVKNGRRAYALLRDVLRRTNKVGIARVVLRSRLHLAALLVDGDLLVLNLLRFATELRDAGALDVPKEGGKGTEVSPQELNMAEKLVETMVSDWQPEKYRDDYREDLMKVIEEKIAAGQTKSVESEPVPQPRTKGKVVDIMHLLRESVERASKTPEEPARRRKAS